MMLTPCSPSLATAVLAAAIRSTCLTRSSLAVVPIASVRPMKPMRIPCRSTTSVIGRSRKVPQAPFTRFDVIHGNRDASTRNAVWSAPKSKSCWPKVATSTPRVFRASTIGRPRNTAPNNTPPARSPPNARMAPGVSARTDWTTVARRAAPPRSPSRSTTGANWWASVK